MKMLVFIADNTCVSMPTRGREEAVFPPDCAKRDSSLFWSYAFV